MPVATEPTTHRRNAPTAPLVDPTVSDEERTLTIFMHLGGLAHYFLPVLGGVLAPLILWLIKRHDSPFVDDHGREAINFQISMLIYGIISGILLFVAIGFVLIPILTVMHLVYCILMAVRAGRGEYVRYPITIRFLR